MRRKLDDEPKPLYIEQSLLFPGMPGSPYSAVSPDSVIAFVPR